MTEESRYTIGDAPQPPVPAEEPVRPPSDSERAEDAEQPAPADDAAGGPGPKEAWREVITQIDALADSMTRWAKTAVNDPENRRHAVEIREKLDAVGTKIGSAVDEAAQSDIGRSVAEAADKTGHAIVDVGGKVAQETGPAVATALTGLAGLLGKAAEKVGEATATEPSAAAPDHVDDAEQDDAAASAADETASRPRAGE